MNNEQNELYSIIETNISKTDLEQYRTSTFAPSDVEFFNADKLGVDIAPEYVNALTADGYTVFACVALGDYASRDGVTFDRIQYN